VTVYCGIDWAEGHHDIALVDGDGKLVAITTTPAAADSVGFAYSAITGTWRRVSRYNGPANDEDDAFSA
jgi:hypothetical protein